jgi:hypothetical protein
MAVEAKYTLIGILRAKGDKTSVLVPIKTLKKINDDFIKMEYKLRILTGIKSSLSEIKKAKLSGKKLQTLNNFLNESNS